MFASVGEIPLTAKGLRHHRETGSVNLMESAEHSAGPQEMVRTISLVIPVHNGAEFVSQSVTEARQFLDRICPAHEIVVVDDGSTDGTSDVLEAFVDQRFSLVRLAENIGKYGALKAGMAAATGRCRVFTDADLPYDLEALPYIADLVNGKGFDKYPDKVLNRHGLHRFRRPLCGIAFSAGKCGVCKRLPFCGPGPRGRPDVAP